MKIFHMLSLLVVHFYSSPLPVECSYITCNFSHIFAPRSGSLKFDNRFEQPDKCMKLPEKNHISHGCKMPAEEVCKISNIGSRNQLAWRCFETQTCYKDNAASQLNTFLKLCLYLNSTVKISKNI